VLADMGILKIKTAGMKDLGTARGYIYFILSQ